jgi:hypothetical protein
LLPREARPRRCLVAFAALVACSEPATPLAPLPPGGAPHAVARAREWASARLAYCQAPNHTRDFDGDCATTCDREDHPAWDAYRSDCSGLVAWAWQLPAPGITTRDLAPFQIVLTHVIPALELRPGDAINNRHHTMLFAEWVARPYVARFVEEPGCHAALPYAQEITRLVRTTGTSLIVFGHGRYTAIRNDDAL